MIVLEYSFYLLIFLGLSKYFVLTLYIQSLVYTVVISHPSSLISLIVVDLIETMLSTFFFLKSIIDLCFAYIVILMIDSISNPIHKKCLLDCLFFYLK